MLGRTGCQDYRAIIVLFALRLKYGREMQTKTQRSHRLVHAALGMCLIMM